MRCVFLLVISILVNSSTTAEELKPESATLFEQSLRPVLVETCGDCHDPDDAENAVPFLSATKAEAVATHRGLWKNVAEQLRNRTMPPADAVQPSEEDRLRIANWIDETLRQTACQLGEYAGQVVSRRLNRIEYDNTIRDLLGVDLDVSDTFPVDGSGGEGFNNNGETLFLPPILMERYLEAATTALDAAIVTPRLKKTFRPDDLQIESKSQRNSNQTLPKKSAANAFVTVYVAGDYTIRVTAATTESHPAKVVLKLDGIAANRFEFTGEKNKPIQESAVVRLARGVHAITIRTEETPLTIHRLEITENRNEPSDRKLENHQKLLGRSPGDIPKNPRDAAYKVLKKFTRRAFRRPVGETEIEGYLSLYDRAAERGDPYPEAVKLAMKAVLVSPHFLFRVEDEPNGSQLEPIGDHELAVRLSYFLWSSMPDDELNRLADAGKLHERDVLTSQINRMLNDPKADIFAEQFIGQWLGTQKVGNGHAPDTSTFRDQFTFKLVFDMQAEPFHLFAHILEQNRSLLELIDSDYTILNRRMQVHYGLIKPPKDAGSKWVLNQYREKDGGSWELVELPNDQRGGVLGTAGVHMLTSYPNRTSPVLRGGWVLETLLGVHVPSPPPDVPELKRGKKEKKSLREQLAMHRDHSACAACHNLMDPVGFALENFDVLGRWREKDGNQEIDASATLPTGQKINGPAGLRKALLDRKDDFLRQLTRKMLGYALGRSLTDADDCTIGQITDAVTKDDYKARTLVREIVLSTPFRMRSGPSN
ncbi:DUF1592 domain-containing protein [Thalassoroseus pseudoceratinae]|uniref:DUF1592 domain-containing protein n=1 Tax=Thalassoroseus pseudoceratinae TaxID=2713176 RepID=UPI00142411ED|nr:DUF1592 domain-containing protein [Thalassoroseus pseudoceratinae]